MKRKVSYYYDNNVSAYSYGDNHPMHPHRMQMTHSLVVGYDLYKKMAIYRPRLATDKEILQFHQSDYITFLKSINLRNASLFQEQMKTCSLISHSCGFLLHFAL
jgi:acetoin utilization deacetylase AcuC-like enzyme